MIFFHTLWLHPSHPTLTNMSTPCYCVRWKMHTAQSSSGAHRAFSRFSNNESTGSSSCQAMNFVNYMRNGFHCYITIPMNTYASYAWCHLAWDLCSFSYSKSFTLCRKLSQPSGVGILCRWLPMLSNLLLLYCSIATGQCLEKLEAFHIRALPSCMLLYSFLFPAHRRTWSLSCVSQHILQHYS